MIKKLDKLLVRFIMKKEKAQIANIENERDNVTRDYRYQKDYKEIL